MNLPENRVRVIQWATGDTGRRALREIIRDPRLELAGVLVYDPQKEGVDAGDLCGEPATGIKATTDRARILNLEADCVSYMARASGSGITRAGLTEAELTDDIVALTESGKNIVTTCTDLIARGRRLSKENLARIDAACRAGGASIYVSGSSPGLLTETIPLPFLSFARRIDHMEIEEFGSLARRPSPNMVLEQMRFGKPLDQFDPDRRKNHLFGEYQPAIEMLSESAGLAIDEWKSEGGVAAARQDTEIVSGLIKAGTAGAQRIVISGHAGGVERIRFVQYMYVTKDVEPDWDLQDTGWRIRIQGDAPVDMRYPFPVPPEKMADYVPAYNANVLVNAIPYLSDAPEGIVTLEELPAILAKGPGTRRARLR